MDQKVEWKASDVARLKEFCKKWQITFDEFLETLDPVRTERFFRAMEGNVEPVLTMKLESN